MHPAVVFADLTTEGMVLMVVIVSAIALLFHTTLTAVVRWYRSGR